jgi:uncharacterized cupredoxin-like copper-binding protein
MRRFVLILGVGLVLLGLTVGAGASPAVQKVTITMTEFKYAPQTVTLRAGVPAEITLVNQGRDDHELMVYAPAKTPPDAWDDYAMAHTYFHDMGEVMGTFPGQGHVSGTRIFEILVAAHRSAVLSFTPKTKGIFEMGCHLPGHYESGMKGVWVVK